MKPLKIDWTKHLQDPDKKEAFEKTLRNNTLVIARLRDIVDEWEATLLNEETLPNQYSVANWTELQAHRNGNREMIKRVKNLLDFF